MVFGIKWSDAAANDLAGFGDRELSRALVAFAEQDLNPAFPVPAGNPDEGMVDGAQPPVAWRRAIWRSEATRIGPTLDGDEYQYVDTPTDLYWLIYRPPTGEERLAFGKAFGQALDFVIDRVFDAREAVTLA